MSDRTRPFPMLMNLPGAAVTGVLILFALALLVFLSLRGNDGSLLGTGFTLQNYLTLATDPLYGMVLLRSLVISGLVTLATVVTAFPVAWFLAYRAGRWRGLILFAVTAPFWTSYLLRVFAWRIIFAFNGVLNSALLGLGLTDKPVMTFINSPYAVVVTLAHAYAPFAILPIYVALQTIPASLREAAADLGARPRTIFLRIVLPLSMPGVLAGAVVVFVPTLGDYVTPALVGGPTSTLIGSLIQSSFGKANDWPFGAALAVAVMAVILSIGLVSRAVNRRIGGLA